ncbi:hypothetical protein CYMTET_10394 [Cymbomonas tetramitiformis]|uniref:Uncharacterized protein n=1 Tax=Cymbomonas tetramitiformis TaxID=36881 RepID=A0AAE0LEI5_9CHLO|nr:hypothetical protein CYMTET_10394 [Cymbomonas tetramitiformis]
MNDKRRTQRNLEGMGIRRSVSPMLRDNRQSPNNFLEGRRSTPQRTRSANPAKSAPELRFTYGPEEAYAAASATQSNYRAAQRAKELIAQRANEYAAKSPPPWVLKCIIALDKHCWKMNEKHAAYADDLQDYLEVERQRCAEQEDRIAQLEYALMYEKQAHQQTHQELQKCIESNDTLKGSSTALEKMVKYTMAETSELRGKLELERARGSMMTLQSDSRENEINQIASDLRMLRMKSDKDSVAAKIGLQPNSTISYGAAGHFTYR